MSLRGLGIKVVDMSCPYGHFCMKEERLFLNRLSAKLVVFPSFVLSVQRDVEVGLEEEGV